MDYTDDNTIAKELNRIMKRLSEDSLHELNKRKQSSPIHNKKSPRVVRLPQPIAQ